MDYIRCTRCLQKLPGTFEHFNAGHSINGFRKRCKNCQDLPDKVKHSGARDRRIAREDGKPVWCPSKEAMRLSRLRHRAKHGPRKQIRVHKNDYKKRIKLNTWISELKIKQGCVICGYNLYPESLDFDHLPGFEKHKGIGALIRDNASIEKIEAEIAKCQVLCANCHRHITRTRRLTKSWQGKLEGAIFV